MPSGPAGSDDEAAERRDRARLARLAAPGSVAALTALVTAVTASLDAFDLPVAAQAGLTTGAALLAGLVAYGSMQVNGGEEQREVEPGAPVVPAQLPPAVPYFTGRTESLAELRRTLDGARSPVGPLVVALHGPGGVGKSALATRFAHEIADEFPDGQLYFDLRGHGDARVRPEEVLIGFLLALGVRLSTDPGGLSDLRKLWWTWARGKRLLVFLDNAHDDEQVRALLPPVAGCAVLVTSRQPLALGATRNLRLREFTAANGVELLRRLAGDTRVDADPGAAAEIVELCGRLPLAISICGGRLATREHWSPAEMAGRLRDERRGRLDELEVARHIDKSVRASLQLSYDDCTPIQRRLLRALALLTAPDVQGWVAGALLGLAELEGDDELEYLVDAQLVECSGTDATGAMRYRLHDLVRLYARERAEREDTEEERRAALERVVDGYRERAEQAAAARWPQDWHRQSGPRRANEYPAAEWLSSERLALLAIVNQADEAGMWHLLWRLGRAMCSLFHSLRIFWQEWRAVADLTCKAAERLADPRSEGIARLERSAVAGGQGQAELARADSARALEIFTELGEGWWRARALRAMGMNMRDAGAIDGGQRYLEDAIATFEAEGDQWWQARTQRNLAELRVAQRRYEEAREMLEEALEVFRRNGNRYSEAQTLRALGEVLAVEGRRLREQGDIDGAEAKHSLAAPTLERAAETFRLRHEEWEEARCLRAAGDVGDPRNGLRELTFIRQAERMLERLGDSWGVARTKVAEGRALGRLGRHREAAETIEQAMHAFRELGDRWWQARCLRNQAEVLILGGLSDEAVRPATEALEIYRSLGNEAGETRAQDVLARARTGALSG